MPCCFSIGDPVREECHLLDKQGLKLLTRENWVKDVERHWSFQDKMTAVTNDTNSPGN